MRAAGKATLLGDQKRWATRAGVEAQPGLGIFADGAPLRYRGRLERDGLLRGRWELLASSLVTRDGRGRVNLASATGTWTAEKQRTASAEQPVLVRV